MKKVLALVLAVMMLAVVAFAATNDVKNPADGSNPNNPNFMPGEKIKITALGVQAKNPNYVFDSQYDASSNPSKLRLKEINSENYSITSVKYNEGKNLVEAPKFNDKNDRVEILVKQNFDMTKGKTLKMEFDLKGKKVGKSEKPDTIHVIIEKTISYGLNKNNPAGSGIVILSDDDVQLPSRSGTYEVNSDGTQGAEKAQPNGLFHEDWVYKVQKGASSDYSYGNMEFDTADDDVEVEVRVYEDDELYLYNDTDSDDDILKAYADADADLTFLNFKGAPTFNSTATVRFYKEEDTYVYGMKDGKLTSINAKWDDDEGCFVLKTRTLGGYVFSDKKLNVSASTAADNNPDTGANDVVGIATALAAVALVSAAAVSLKK